MIIKKIKKKIISSNLIDVISIFNQVEKFENLNQQLKIKLNN